MKNYKKIIILFSTNVLLIEALEQHSISLDTEGH